MNDSESGCRLRSVGHQRRSFLDRFALFGLRIVGEWNRIVQSRSLHALGRGLHLNGNFGFGGLFSDLIVASGRDRVVAPALRYLLELSASGGTVQIGL
jgi:hypothetical protein